MLKVHHQYLVECCTLASDDASRQRLCSVRRHKLAVLRHRLNILGRPSVVLSIWSDGLQLSPYGPS